MGKGRRPGPRIRTIKPGYWLDEKVLTLEIGARYAMLGLISQADDEGYVTADPQAVNSKVFGGQCANDKVALWLSTLEQTGMIRPITYERQDGKTERYYLVVNFTEHQYIERPKPSYIAMKLRDAAPAQMETAPPSPPPDPNVAHKYDVGEVVDAINRQCPNAKKDFTPPQAGELLRYCQQNDIDPRYIISRINSKHDNPYLWLKKALSPKNPDRLVIPSDFRRIYTWDNWATRSKGRRLRNVSTLGEVYKKASEVSHT